MEQEPLQKHPEQSEEEWQEELAERRAFAKRLWRQSGGQRDVFPYQGSRPEPKQ